MNSHKESRDRLLAAIPDFFEISWDLAAAKLDQAFETGLSFPAMTFDPRFTWSYEWHRRRERGISHPRYYSQPSPMAIKLGSIVVGIQPNHFAALRSMGYKIVDSETQKPWEALNEDVG